MNQSAEIDATCGHPNHGAADHDCGPFGVVPDGTCMCGADGGEGCYCCTDECPEDCMTDHKGEQ